ncbi:MAG: DUF4270 domain-containing protein [Gelidibacter sp.]|nr:DUF4270 domain-containing protein [Gelidibacter sp.]
MKNIKIALKNLAVLTVLASLAISCDKDFATLGSDIAGQNNFGTVDKKYDVIAYSKKLKPVQTNGLPANLLGVYKDPLYGLTTANFVSQVNPSSLDPTFGEGVILDSVVLTVPYFSKATGTDDNGATLYELDSVYGSSPIKLHIYESNYFLRSFDPNSEFNESQKYYSDGSTSMTNTIDETQLKGTVIYSDDNFEPSNKQIILKDVDENVTDRLAPALRIKLSNAFWQAKIMDKEGSTELSNLNNFQDYFRGLYFKTESIADDGTMALLNFAASTANVTLYYSKDPIDENSETRITSTYVLTFGSNRVNFLSNQFNFPLQDGNSTTGDEKLYLKGGEGSIAYIDLFDGENHDEDDANLNTFETFKNDFVETDANGKFIKAKRLVNEANLVFYVDQTQAQSQEPDRIYLFDAKNNTALIDYAIDIGNSVSANDSKTNHLGKLIREGNTPNGQGIKYKLKITEHINNLLLRDSTNVKLGLAVSGNVNLEGQLSQRNILTDETTENKIPVSSIISPRGTVLYGNNTTDEAKKLHLEIFYTCIRTDGDCDDN